VGPDYHKWWVGRRVRRAGTSRPFKKCVDLTFTGPPSRVYGFVTLHYDDGTTEDISPATGFKPRKRDIDIHPDDRDKPVCIYPFKSRAEYSGRVGGEAPECSLDVCGMYPTGPDYREGKPKCRYKRRPF